MRDELKLVLRGYAGARLEPLTDHSLAAFISHDLAYAVRRLVASDSYKITRSPGPVAAPLNPDSTLLGKYSPQLAAGGQMADQLGLLAFWFGAIAVELGIISGLGGKGSGTSVTSILLGIAAMSYPVLTALNLVKQYVPNPIG